MNTERIKKFVGGQAVIEGVMMRALVLQQLAVREPSGTIVVQKSLQNLLLTHIQY